MKNVMRISADTVIYTDTEGMTVFSVQDTPLVSYNDRRVLISTGGRKNLTTRRRLNKASKVFDLGYNIVRLGEDWFARLPNGHHVPFDDVLEMPRQQYKKPKPEKLVLAAE